MHLLHKIKAKYLLIALMAILLGFSACKKNYYLDSGLANPYFKGSVLDYMQSKPFYFDTVATVVQLSGMDSIFISDTMTFFAPTDRSVMRLILATNQSLYRQGFDTIRTLSDVPATIWRKYLSRYMFHGENQLKDYPQIDYDLLSNYPGQGYLSWDGTPMNIGVIYNDENSVKYVGYRQLSIAYIPDISAPTENWVLAYVASSNILTNNGVVHVLSDEHEYFGFVADEFFSDMTTVMASGGVK